MIRVSTTLLLSGGGGLVRPRLPKTSSGSDRCCIRTRRYHHRRRRVTPTSNTASRTSSSSNINHPTPRRSKSTTLASIQHPHGHHHRHFNPSVLATASSSLQPSRSGTPSTCLDLGDPESRQALQSFVDALSLLSNANEEQQQQHQQNQPRYQSHDQNQHLISNPLFDDDDNKNRIIESQEVENRTNDHQIQSTNNSDSSEAGENIVSTTEESNKQQDEGWIQELVQELEYSTRRHDAKRSFELYSIAKQNKIVLKRRHVADLFFVLAPKDPITAFSVLRYYNDHPRTESRNVAMYKRLCTCVSVLDPAVDKPRWMHKFVEELLDDIRTMDDEAKNVLYPNLVVTLATQRRVTLGRYAGMLYEHMKENNFDFRLSWLLKVLSLSKYNRQEDLPFHDIMAEYAARGGTNRPAVILSVIQNMFPYTDVEQMTVVLRSYLQIENNTMMEKKQEDERHNRPSLDGINDDNDVDDGTYKTNGIGDGTPQDIEDDEATTTSARVHGHNNTIMQPSSPLKIDISTLEMISAGAARTGNSELMMLVWDVMDYFKYVPTEAIYENAILSFGAERNRGIHQALSVMAVMKKDGFVPSRPLIRSLCLLLRSDKRLVNKAIRIILNEDSGVVVSEDEDINDISRPLLSLESLNLVLSCLAERGDTTDALDLLHMFQEYDIQPNHDSYSFVMESLGKEIHRLQLADPTNEHNSQCIRENLELAGSLLTEMEDHGLTPSAPVVRNYLELLCLAKEVVTATAIIDDLLGGEFKDRVSNKSIYRVAIANVDAGNFDKASELEGQTTEFIPILFKKIRSRRERSKRWEEKKNTQLLQQEQQRNSNIVDEPKDESVPI
mmetsp:Transcript_57634/g.140778  ORF Transcript_57634/g.140778 Transcript_57634/m.140778 type:complete len:840 (+) Transcript_57634:48-2567(+)